MPGEKAPEITKKIVKKYFSLTRLLVVGARHQTSNYAWIENKVR